jgi:hypothetical protein
MSVDPIDPAASRRLAPGARVEVRNHFDGSWAGGFEIADKDPGGYWLRRTSDRVVLPSRFSPGDVRTVGAA